MTKAIITKEQAKAIEYLRTTVPYYDTDEKLIISHAETLMPKGHGSESTWGPQSAALNGMPLSTFSRAILNGYEIEKTPEEEVAALYHAYGNIFETFDEGVQFGIKQTLSRLGIKVKGVND